MPKYEIKSNLSEEQIVSDFTSYLGHLTRLEMHYRLQVIDESETGADRLLSNNGVPLFLQFKASTGLHPISEIPASTRSNRSKKEDIREFRSKNELPDNPTLYFQLRRKAKTADDLQHNILRKISLLPDSYGFYMAPLSLEKNEYQRVLFDSVIPNSHYFEFRFHMVRGMDSVHFLGQIPFFKNHISISPHVEVESHNHFYAYSESGFHVTWHSPEIPEGISLRFGDRIVSILSHYYRRGRLPLFKDVIESIPRNTFLDAENVAYASDFFEFVERLKKEYRIYTFILYESR